jgi:hypothetical protein
MGARYGVTPGGDKKLISLLFDAARVSQRATFHVWADSFGARSATSFARAANHLQIGVTKILDRWVYAIVKPRAPRLVGAIGMTHGPPDCALPPRLGKGLTCTIV